MGSVLYVWASMKFLPEVAVELLKHKNSYQCTAQLSFVLKVSLRYLRPSIIYSVPCDRIVQRAY